MIREYAIKILKKKNNPNSSYPQNKHFLLKRIEKLNVVLKKKNQ